MSDRSMRETNVGKIVNNKVGKTAIAAIQDNVGHPLYNKTAKRTVKLKARDENNECNIGDHVRVMETCPLSKEKRWYLVKTIEKAK